MALAIFDLDETLIHGDCATLWSEQMGRLGWVDPESFMRRNNELMDNPGQPPEGFGAEHRMESEITELDPPYRLAISWGSTGGVTFELEPVGDMVRFTLSHRRIPDRSIMLNVSAGWHAHLDVLAARLEGEEPAPFWDHWAGLKADYEKRIPA